MTFTKWERPWKVKLKKRKFDEDTHWSTCSYLGQMFSYVLPYIPEENLLWIYLSFVVFFRQESEYVWILVCNRLRVPIQENHWDPPLRQQTFWKMDRQNPSWNQNTTDLLSHEHLSFYKDIKAYQRTTRNNSSVSLQMRLPRPLHLWQQVMKSYENETQVFANSFLTTFEIFRIFFPNRYWHRYITHACIC